jgi:pSer/pThr/pTyr-binding forkhead associated (FHA) protein
VVGFVLSKRHTAVPGPPGVAAPPGAPPVAVPPKAKKRGKQEMPPPPPPPPIAGPSLLVLSGPLSGQRIALQNGFTIGKAPTSNLVLDDGYTSTQHAQVGMDQFGNCRLYDRNSTNGTFVNGVRVTEVVLDHGMSVRIGSTELRFLAQ